MTARIISFTGWRLYLLIFGIVFLVYLPSIHSQYMLDDSHAILNNSAIQSWSGIAKAFLSARSYSSLPANWGYRPVAVAISTVAWMVGGGAPWAFHLIKILIFSGLCFLLVSVWQKLLPQASREVVFLASVLFAVNPVHTQVVIYVCQISTLLAGFFVLLSTYFYLQYRSNRNTWPYIFMLLSILLAALSKEEGIVSVGLIPLTEIYIRYSRGEKILDFSFVKLVFALAVPGLIGVGLIFSMYEPETSVGRGFGDRATYFITQWRAYVRYFAMYFFSYDLNMDNLEFGFDYDRFAPRVIFSAMANLLLLGVAIRYIKTQPWAIFSLLWFYMGISPASSIIPLAEPVNDHRAFIGYFGFGLFSVMAFDYLSHRSRKLLYRVAVGWILLYSVQTIYRSFIWKEADLMWIDVIEKNPTSPRARNNLAVIRMREARYDEALTLLRDCVKYGPRYHICFVNLAVVSAALGKDQEAEDSFEKSMGFETSKFTSLLFYSQFLIKRGFIAKPIELLKQADETSKGGNLEVRLLLIELYRKSLQIDAALKAWRGIYELYPENDTLKYLGKEMGAL